MGPTWPFLLMYGSHDMRHTGFHKLTVVNGTPGSGCHKFGLVSFKEIVALFEKLMLGF